MRVRILKPFYFARRNVSYRPDEVVDAPREDAEVWLKAGMAMQDKSMEPKEIKERPKPETIAPAPARYTEEAARAVKRITKKR